jgi:SAM-dependent methyltransferase
MVPESAPTSVAVSDAGRQATRAGYDILADEYYSTRHITSRNFDMATLAYLRGKPVSFPNYGLALDLGAGKGRLNEYCGIDPTRIVQVDLSARMLMLPAREPSLGRVQADALALPFKSEAFTMVAAFLFDPFNRDGLFAEIARVTRTGGIFIGTIPHHQWGLALRSGKGRSIDEAVFILENGKPIAQPSVLSQSEQLKDRLADVGFSTVSNETLKMPREVTNISPDIELPARMMKQSVHSIPIVQLVIAMRS